MKFEQTLEFQKELKKLSKKWRSLPKDLKNAQKVINLLYNNQLFRDNFLKSKKATILTTTENKEVIKMRLDCASLGNNKRTRLIFIGLKSENKVNFIELYAEDNNKSREDQKRINKYLKNN